MCVGGRGAAKHLELYGASICASVSACTHQHQHTGAHANMYSFGLARCRGVVAGRVSRTESATYQLTPTRVLAAPEGCECPPRS